MVQSRIGEKDTVGSMVRMPADLRDRIKASADKNGRSLNSEIVETLTRNYPAPSDVMHVHLHNIRKALDLYEASNDPQERLRLQGLVEMMASAGHNLWFDEEDVFE